MMPMALPLFPSVICYTAVFVVVRRSHNKLKRFDPEHKENKGKAYFKLSNFITNSYNWVTKG